MSEVKESDTPKFTYGKKENSLWEGYYIFFPDGETKDYVGNNEERAKQVVKELNHSMKNKEPDTIPGCLYAIRYKGPGSHDRWAVGTRTRSNWNEVSGKFICYDVNVYEAIPLR